MPFSSGMALISDGGGLQRLKQWSHTSPLHARQGDNRRRHRESGRLPEEIPWNRGNRLQRPHLLLLLQETPSPPQETGDIQAPSRADSAAEEVQVHGHSEVQAEHPRGVPPLQPRREQLRHWPGLPPLRRHWVTIRFVCDDKPLWEFVLRALHIPSQEFPWRQVVQVRWPVSHSNLRRLNTEGLRIHLILHQERRGSQD